MAHGELTLDLLTFLMVYRRETRQRPHLVFAGGDRYFPLENRAGAMQALDDELHQLGLLDGTRLQPDFQDTLGLLANARVEFFGWVQHEQSNFAVLAASVGKEALLATRTGEQVWLKPGKVENPGELAGQLVTLLPKVNPADIRPFAVNEADLASVGATANQGSLLDRPRSAQAIELRQLEDLFKLRRSGGGALYAAIRDQQGNRHQVEDKLDYIDTVNGRVLSFFTGDGQARARKTRTLNIAPGSPKWLSDKLATLPSGR
ncbi:ESAT-6 protein secretion system EspG family protein [Tamaricihabitans halophyticus]|uniref:ESAT-6 protein secretion system EspG family protein n=1 Tax=Tamaricihabitans halophyticus TaxID=1262583 RepID=A0A4R2R696_9PSEU|nr:ESX secretion-associated protein EspG [Tamaricihabitans halophyticus]TCP57379.1 ESAT-6 protein secretion system EspG family protein [Tamaricihabitans halophyticus]